MILSNDTFDNTNFPSIRDGTTLKISSGEEVSDYECYNLDSAEIVLFHYSSSSSIGYDDGSNSTSDDFDQERHDLFIKEYFDQMNMIMTDLRSMSNKQCHPNKYLMSPDNSCTTLTPEYDVPDQHTHTEVRTKSFLYQSYQEGTKQGGGGEGKADSPFRLTIFKIIKSWCTALVSRRKYRT